MWRFCCEIMWRPMLNRSLCFLHAHSVTCYRIYREISRYSKSERVSECSGFYFPPAVFDSLSLYPSVSGDQSTRLPVRLPPTFRLVVLISYGIGIKIGCFCSEVQHLNIVRGYLGKAVSFFVPILPVFICGFMSQINFSPQ